MRAHATPRVSMAVPVYNGERYLGEALDSLLAQTYHDFELIICDNASTDGTGEIARSYASMDERVRYVRNERNLGLAGNVKRAFQLSSGEYFRWHAADDVCAPQFLARCVAVLDRHPAVVLAYPRTKLIDADGRVTAAYDDGLHLQAARPSVRFQQLLERVGYVNAQFGLLRAEVLRRTGLLGSYPAADVVFVAQLSLHGTFWEVPSFLFYRRFHPGAASRMDRAQLRVVWDPTSGRRSGSRSSCAPVASSRGGRSGIATSSPVRCGPRCDSSRRPRFPRRDTPLRSWPLGVLSRQRRLPAPRRRDHRRGAGRALHAQEERRVVSTARGAVLPSGGRNRTVRARVRRLLRQAAPQVRADPRDLSRGRPQRLHLLPHGGARVAEGKALHRPRHPSCAGR